MSAKKRKRAAASSEAKTDAPVASAPTAPEAPQPEASLLQRWAFGPVAAVRPYLAARFVLFLLAVDVWATHLGPAWRYGTAGFNVPHFDWVDRVLPAPTALTYVGMLALVSAGGAIAASLARPPAWLIASIAALYLWGWSSSMHDSYQHHYLLSWVLLVIAALPMRPASELFGPSARGASAPAGAHWLVRLGSASLPHGPVPRTRAWQYRLLTVLPAVVYAYTAVSKLEPDWRSGDALRSLTRGGEDIEAFLALLRARGVEGEAVWPLLGAATIAIQVLVSLSYWLAPLADGDVDPAPDAVRRRRWSLALGAAATTALVSLAVVIATEPYAIAVVPALAGLALAALAMRRLGADVSVPGLVQGVCLVGMLAAIAFHIGAEDMGLEIGWFSYYMIGLALVVLLPAEPLSTLTAAITEPLRVLDRALGEATPPVLSIGAGALSLVALALLGDFALAPGAYEASLAVGAVLMVLALASLARPALARPMVELAPGVLVVALAAFFVLREGGERFDYFRFAGGDFRRRGEPAAALAAYRRALELAPEEERDRIAGRVRELEALVPSE